MSKTCGAPGCIKPTARSLGKDARTINGIDLCRGCYQRAWDLEKTTGVPKEEIFRKGLPPAIRPLPRIATRCERDGCKVRLPKNAGPLIRRTIGLHHVCNPCYQLAWEHSVKDGVTIEQAFDALKPKWWRAEPKPLVTCCMPWCSTQVKPSTTSALGDGHVCGKCRAYLHCHAKREKHASWEQSARLAIAGGVLAPGSPQMCSMPWCNRVEVVDHYGPNGQPICTTDAAYLRNYRKRHGLTFAAAFRKAPPPLRRGFVRK